MYGRLFFQLVEWYVLRPFYNYILSSIQMKEYLKDPSKFAVAAAPVAAAASAKVEAKVEEEEEASDDDMGFGLFD